MCSSQQSTVITVLGNANFNHHTSNIDFVGLIHNTNCLLQMQTKFPSNEFAKYCTWNVNLIQFEDDVLQIEILNACKNSLNGSEKSKATPRPRPQW